MQTNPREKQSPQKQLGKKQTKDEMAHREGQFDKLQVKPIRAGGNRTKMVSVKLDTQEKDYKTYQKRTTKHNRK